MTFIIGQKTKMPRTKVHGTTHMDMNELSLFIFIPPMWIMQFYVLKEEEERYPGLQLRGARDSKALETM